MKILFVWSAAEFSTFDVARGYRNALARAGHEIIDYRLYNRLKYHALALSHNDPPRHKDHELVMRLSAETMVAEAIRNDVEVVVGICGMGLHPDGLHLLNKAGFPIAMIFTEAPYDDEHHVKYAKFVGHPFTNEIVSARDHGWTYLGAAYDPEFHFPRRPLAKEECDVLIIGTGWAERQALLETVDWTGINLRIRGWWGGITKDSPLRRYYREGGVANQHVPVLYASAKICVNQHRGHPTAQSLNPRAYELAAAGALQVSDVRAELAAVYGMTVPLYRDGPELEFQIRHLLSLSHEERAAIALQQHTQLVAGRHTFDDRAARLMAEITGGNLN